MRKRSFTLLELLIVIAILAVLAGTMIPLFRASGAEARDARRKYELEIFKKVLEQFFFTHGYYPCGDCDAAAADFDDGEAGTVDSAYSDGFLNANPGSPVANCCDHNDTNCGNASIDWGLQTEGILADDWPKDPVNDMTAPPYRGYVYYVNRDRDKYVVATFLEDDLDSMANDCGKCADAYEVGTGVGEIDPGQYIGVPNTCCVTYSGGPSCG